MGGSAILASENRCAVLHVAFNDEALAAIRDPTLMPDLPRRIVNAEALSFVTFNALIIFVKDAAIENTVDANASVLCGVGDIEGIPIAEPEVEFVILGGAEHGVDIGDLPGREIMGISTAMKKTKRERRLTFTP
jgi:hypothetical protein